jgi:hypothetical protein
MLGKLFCAEILKQLCLTIPRSIAVLIAPKSGSSLHKELLDIILL